MITRFGLGGRLGLGHENTTVKPAIVTGYAGKPRAVAVGPDHTLMVTVDGKLYSWGSNTCGQLGYSTDDKNQLSPRNVLLPKQELVLGVAASKIHSAAFTNTGSLYQWGTNVGQLGFASSNVQITPRKATMIPQLPISQIKATDSCTIVLTACWDVYLIRHGISGYFTLPLFLDSPALGKQRKKAPNVIKICAGNELIAFIMSNGNAYIYNPADSDETVKLVWDSKRKRQSAIECAIQSADAVLILTSSGQVYQGNRHKNQSYSFQLCPNLDNIIGIAANSDCSYLAIRSDSRPSKRQMILTNSFAGDIDPKLNSLRKDHDFVIILKNDCKIFAHQSILSLNSSWFSKLFRGNDTKIGTNIEYKTGELRVKDVEADDFLLALKILYSGNFENSSSYTNDTRALCNLFQLRKPIIDYNQNSMLHHNMKVTLCNGELLCNSTLFSRKSQYFEALFGQRSLWSPRLKSCDRIFSIQLPHIDAGLFRLVWLWVIEENSCKMIENINVTTEVGCYQVMIDVLKIADELLIFDLISFCSSFLVRFLKISNALELLTIGVKFNALELVNTVVEFSISY